MSVEEHLIEENDGFPNNPDLPLLHYKKALEPSETGSVKELFAENNWGNAWVDGIFSYHHFHSNTHEVLGITRGSCKVVIGGEGGKEITVEKGDVLVIPAGVSHKNVGSSQDFTCVGAYPSSMMYDMHEGDEEELESVKKTIRHVPLPEKDPVKGAGGPLFDHWSTRN